MKYPLALLLSFGLLAAPFPPSAQTKPTKPAAAPAACLMEGRFVFLGQQLDISDCIQNDGAPHDQLLTACNGISEMATGMGIPAPTTTWRASCPAKPQGRCLHMNGTKLTAYYYKRPVQDLPDVKSSCELMGGRYAEG